ATLKERRTFQGHRGSVLSLAFSSDGKLLASGNADTTTLIWDVTAAPSEQGPQAAQISSEELNLLWTDLAGADALKAYRATCRLGSAPRETVIWLRERLRPAFVANPKRLAQLVTELDSSHFRVREKATAELEK